MNEEFKSINRNENTENIVNSDSDLSDEKQSGSLIPPWLR